MSALSTVLWVLAGLLIAVVLWKVGIGMLRGLITPAAAAATRPASSAR